MRFGKKSTRCPCYVGSYHILRIVRNVFYEFDLSLILGSIHLVFYVSMLKKCAGDPSFIFPI